MQSHDLSEVTPNTLVSARFVNTKLDIGNTVITELDALSSINGLTDLTLVQMGERTPAETTSSEASSYISRVDSLLCRIVYFGCVFSMVVPFQMVMFTLSRTADKLDLNTPWTIPVIYLGFGAGLAVFMFTGFVKSIPLSIEEAAAIDGCGPVRTYFNVVVPMLKPTLISVGILEIMWIWNDYLLPYLVLDINDYRTIPIHIQYLKGSYGTVDLGATMALILMSIIPVIIFYLCCQKHIIKGVAAGAVKG